MRRTLNLEGHATARHYIFILMLSFTLPVWAQDSAQERMDKAIDYFQSGKYHEAMMLFEKLDEQYALPARHKAYLGVCYFYEWNYEKACLTLDPIIDDMDVFAPNEQSVYYYSDAESHFQSAQYKVAIPLFEKMLTVCHANERGDALYRLGFCYLYLNDTANALEFFSSALAYYLAFPNSERKRQTKQLQHMIAGLARDLQSNQ